LNMLGTSRTADEDSLFMTDMHHYVTAVSTIVSTETEEDVVIRGHRLSALIGSHTFSETVFLLLAGRMPTTGEARTVDSLMTACVDHGVTPAAMIGRAFASYGTTIPQALAGGILLFGTIAGGAGEPLAKLMRAALEEPLSAARHVTPELIESVAAHLVRRSVEAGEHMPGFGVPAHASDPRVPALLDVARANGCAGIYTDLLVAIESELSRVKGKSLPINLDGLVASLVLDLGLPESSVAAFVMISRCYSTLAHHLEEKSQKTRWRHVPPECVEYVGALPG
jgi:citrate synthase